MYTTRRYILCCCSILLLCLCFAVGKAQEHYEPTELLPKLARSQPDTGRVMLYLHLADYYLSKPGELPHDLDSAALLEQQGMMLAHRLQFAQGVAEGAFLDARIYKEKGQDPAAQAKMDEALQLAIRGHFQKLEGRIYMERGYWYGNDGVNFDKKLACMDKARAIFHANNNKVEEGNMLKAIAEIYQFKGRHDTAAVLLEQAVKLYQAIHSKDLAGMYILMQENYRSANNYPLALRYAQLAVQTVEDLHDESQQRVEAYNRMAILYDAMHDFDQALVCMDKAKQAAAKLQDTASIVILNCNIASLYILQGKPAAASALMKATVRSYVPKTVFSGKLSLAMTCVKVFVANHEIAAATPYYNILKEYYNQTANQRDEQVGILFPMVLYLQATRHYRETYPLIDEYATYYTKLNAGSQQVIQAELCYFRADSGLGHLASAIRHYERYKALYDARIKSAQSRLMATMRAQFDLERKDKDIQLLSNQNQLQTTSLRQEQVIRNVVLAGVAMLLILLALIYSRYRTKQRSNLQLQQKQDEINAQNELLKKLLSDKEWLLREIHHRVKNNLQIVISLLNSQSAYLNNDDALEAIRNSQHRMHAMSLIHQKLYQSDNLNAIDMQWYIRELVTYMRQSFDTDKRIRFVLDTTPLLLDVAQAVPLGLILNEAINNAIKYAFPDHRRGEITVRLEDNGDGQFLLSIRDNGVGLPANFNIDQCKSLGMLLMRGLVEQVDGAMQLEQHNGLAIHIHFTLRKEAIATQTRA